MSTIAAHQVMTIDVACATRSTLASEAWAQMRKLNVRHLPVVDERDGNKLVGMVSDRDLLGREGLESMTLSELMTPEPVFVGPQATIAEVCKQLTTLHIDAVPVAGPERQLLGLVTSTDLLRVLALMAEANAPLPMRFTLRGRPRAA